MKKNDAETGTHGMRRHRDLIWRGFLASEPVGRRSAGVQRNSECVLPRSTFARCAGSAFLVPRRTTSLLPNPLPSSLNLHPFRFLVVYFCILGCAIPARRSDCGEGGLLRWIPYRCLGADCPTPEDDIHSPRWSPAGG